MNDMEEKRPYMIKNGSLVISVNTGVIVRVLDYSPKNYFKGTIIGKDTTKKYLYRNLTPIGRTLGILDKTPFIPYYQPYKKLKLI